MEIFSYPFIQRAIIAGILTGLTTGLLGVFVILRRSAFFGDAVSHASLAGVALGLLLEINPLITAALVAILVSLALSKTEKIRHFSIDTILGFILPFFMGVAVIILSFLPGYQPELISFLFGNILTVDWLNLLATVFLSLLIVFFIFFFKTKLIYVTFDQDSARVKGINIEKVLTIYYLLLSLVIVIGLKTMGVILINALLIIPAATAKILARSLSEMFYLTPVISISSVIIGLLLSYYLNLPSGAAIVVYSGLQFIVVLMIKLKR